MGLGMFRHVAQGMRRFDIANRERWFWIGTRLPLLAIFALAGLLGVRAAAWITHGTAVAATLMLLPAAAGAFGRHRLRETKAVLRRDLERLMRYGLRSWSGTLGFMMLLRIDQVLIAPLGGARQLGFYAVAAGAAELPGTALTAVRDVMFATSAERSDPLLAARAARAVVLILTPLCLGAVVVMPIAVPILFGGSFGDAVRPTQLLLLASVPAGIDVVLGAGLLAAGRPGVRSVVQMAAAAILVVGLVVLVPSGGASGGAVAALIARSAGAVMTVAATVRLGGVRARDCFVPRRGDFHDLRDHARRLLRREG